MVDPTLMLANLYADLWCAEYNTAFTKNYFFLRHLFVLIVNKMFYGVGLHEICEIWIN